VTAPEELVVETEHLRFGALAWGDPDAPLALLIHGYPDTAWTWRHVGPALAAKGRRVVAPFTRGYAPTDLAPDDSYLIADLAQDILDLQTALAGDDQAVLIGHDWGAAATWQVTATEPARFARYVTLGLPPTPAILKPFTSPRTLGLAARQARMSWYFIYNQLPGSVAGQDRAIPRLWRDWSPGYDAADDLARTFEALDGPGRRRAVLRYYRTNLQRGIVATFTIKPKASALCLHGEHDGCMHPGVIERYLGSTAPGSQLELIPDCGHFPQLEQPDRVVELIEDWIGPPA
jgi:pimeloyl-ACP methyl ester carboxylesterase